MIFLLYIILEVLYRLYTKFGIVSTGELQLHSDQGFQYTSHAYFKLTQSYNIIPSMSRRGNLYDNALAENFFSILKTECIYRTKIETYEDARILIDEYMSLASF